MSASPDHTRPTHTGPTPGRTASQPDAARRMRRPGLLAGLVLLAGGTTACGLPGLEDSAPRRPPSAVSADRPTTTTSTTTTSTSTSTTTTLVTLPPIEVPTDDPKAGTDSAPGTDGAPEVGSAPGTDGAPEVDGAPWMTGDYYVDETYDMPAGDGPVVDEGTPEGSYPDSEGMVP